VCGLVVALSRGGSGSRPAELQFVWGYPRPVQQLAAERDFNSPNFRAEGYLPFGTDAARLGQSGVAVDRWPIDRERATRDSRAPFFDNGRELQEKGIKMSGFDAEKVWPLFDVRPQLMYTKQQLHRLTLASAERAADDMLEPFDVFNMLDGPKRSKDKRSSDALDASESATMALYDKVQRLQSPSAVRLAGKRKFTQLKKEEKKDECGCCGKSKCGCCGGSSTDASIHNTGFYLDGDHLSGNSNIIIYGNEATVTNSGGGVANGGGAGEVQAAAKAATGGSGGAKGKGAAKGGEKKK